MEREILFRGKRTGDNKWVEGNLEYHPVTKMAFIITPRHIYVDVEMVDPDTVGQYTGLTDKNVKKIFKGDILAGSCSGKSTEYFEVWWSEASCGFVAGRGERMRPNMNQATVGQYEIVGNIYDNPELLQCGGDRDMTRAEVIASLEDQALDKESLAGEEPDGIFARDAKALRQAAEMLRRR